MARAIGVASGSTPIHTLCEDGTASFSGSVGITGSLNPDTDGSREFGRSDVRWKDVHAVCTTVGAIFETGLTTKGIGKYPTGTVLVWDGGLTPCSKSEDPTVMGVVQKGKDQPIILGAEPILVTGKVKPGDMLVTSEKVGHAKAVRMTNLLLFKRNLSGKIVAQALQEFDGESGLIKAMILKI